jgi:MFS family permease
LFGKFSIGWRQVWVTALLMATSSMVTTTYGIIAVPLMQEFGPSRMVLMLTMTVISVVASSIAPWLGAMMDRVPLRRIMLTGAFFLVAGYFALSFVTAFWQVLAVFALFMAPAQLSAGTMASTVLLSRWFSAMRGKAIGLALTGISLGGFIYPIVVQALLDHYDWRTALRLFAVVLALVMVPCVLLVVNRPADVGLHPDGFDSEPEHADAEAHAAAGMTTRRILSDPTFWMIAVILAIFFSGMRGLVTNIAPLAADEGVDATLVAWVLSLYSVAGVCAKLGFAWLADRVDPRKLLLVAMIGAAIAHACLVMADQGFATIAAGAIIMGLFGGTMLPMQAFLVPRIFGRNVVGKVSGLLGLAMFVFNAGSPPLFGLIYDVFGNYDAIFIAYAALMVAAMAMLPYLRLDRRDDPLPVAAAA